LFERTRQTIAIRSHPAGLAIPSRNSSVQAGSQGFHLVTADVEVQIQMSDPQHVAQVCAQPAELDPDAGRTGLPLEPDEPAETNAGEVLDSAEVQQQPGVAGLDQIVELVADPPDDGLLEVQVDLGKADDRSPLDDPHLQWLPLLGLCGEVPEHSLTGGGAD